MSYNYNLITTPDTDQCGKRELFRDVPAVQAAAMIRGGEVEFAQATNPIEGADYGLLHMGITHLVARIDPEGKLHMQRVSPKHALLIEAYERGETAPETRKYH